MYYVRDDLCQQSCLCLEDDVYLLQCLENIVVLHDNNKLDCHYQKIATRERGDKYKLQMMIFHYLNHIPYFWAI